MLSQIAAIGLYFSILVLIGVFSRRKNATDKDFNLGTRQLNFWVTAISAHAGDMSSWLFIAYPMAIFMSGGEKVWIAVGLILGMYASWSVISKRLRQSTEDYDSYTLSTFFERRFKDPSGVIRLLSSAVVLFFMTYYVSAGLVATGRLFEALFQIDYYIGIGIATAIMVSYMYVGGFVSVAWTDFAQGMFLLLALAIVPVIAFFHIDQVDTLFTAAENRNISLSILPKWSFSSLFSILSLTVGWGLGYFGQPHILTKFMAIRQADDLRKSKYLGMAWQITVLAAASAVAYLAFALFPDGLEKPEMVFVEMAKSVFSPFAVILIVCGIFAANMSTMDSQILVCSTTFSEDFYKRVLKKNASSKEILWVSRLGVLLFSSLAFFLAWGQSKTIMSIVEYAWSGLGGSFGPLLIVALYAKKVNSYGAIAGIVAGGMTSAIWPMLNPRLTEIEIVPLFPAFLLSLTVIFSVSWLTRKSPLRIVETSG